MSMFFGKISRTNINLCEVVFELPIIHEKTRADRPLLTRIGHVGRSGFTTRSSVLEVEIVALSAITTVLIPRRKSTSGPKLLGREQFAALSSCLPLKQDPPNCSR